jgi:NAD(P)-dependent dehydrogenase (short-subunit alcohol dehydrogenase family)
LEHLTISGDIGEEQFCQDAVKQVVQAFGQLDVLVNNAAEPDCLTEVGKSQ